MPKPGPIQKTRYFGMSLRRMFLLTLLVVVNLILFGAGVILFLQGTGELSDPIQAIEGWSLIKKSPTGPSAIYTNPVEPPAIHTATASLTVTPSETTSPTPSPSPTPSVTQSATPTASPTSTQTSTPNPSATPSPTPGSVILIGNSVAGRPLEVHRFGNGFYERMIVAGIHGGNEYNTILLANKLIWHLNSHPEIIPADQTLYILPVLNPDGYARSLDIYGRANSHGVDLNHNWPVDWKPDWSRDGCWRYLHLTGGTSPASEPETQALMSFLISHRVEALISYHSAALGIFPAGIPPDPASVRLAESISAVSKYPYPPIDTGCQMTGALVDWAAAQGIAAVDIELTDHRNTDFWQNLTILSVFLKWQP